MKKIILVLVCFFCITSICRASVRTDTFSSTFIGTRHYVFSSGRFGDFEIFRRDSDSLVGYCIEPGVPTYFGEYEGIYDTTIEEVNERTNISIDSLKLILAYAHFGYGYNNHLSDDWYVATQALIWQELGMEFSFTSRNNLSNPFLYVIDTPIDIQDKMNEIVRLVYAYNTDIVFGSDHFKIKPGEELIITDKQNILSNYRVKIATNCTASINGNKLTIKPSNDKSGRITLELNDNSWNNPFVFYVSDYGQNIMTSGIIDKKEYTITYDMDYGSITINKRDKDTNKCNERLVGTIYEVYNQSDELLSTVIMDNNCTATINNLPYGEYHIKEVKTDKSYEVDTKVHYVNVSNSNKNPVLNLYNKEIKREVIINKMYLTSNGIKAEEGAVFSITNNETKDSKTLVIDNKGSSSITLPYGIYTIKQVKGKDNYKFVEDKVINIDKTGDAIVLSLLNEPYTSKLKIIKVDEDGNKLNISNIGFKVLDSNEREVCQHISYPSDKDICIYYTDSYGEVVLPEELETGTYKVIEVEQDIKGYTINTEGVRFNIDKNSPKEVVIKIPNKKVLGIIEIHKELERYNKDLSGIKYSLYNEDNNLIDTYSTNREGIIKIDNLELGTYYIEEVSTFDDYVLDTNKYVIRLDYIDSNTPIVKYNKHFLNKLKRGSIEILKSDISNSNPIPNTKISIYTNSDELVYEGITDNNGKIIINDLVVGKYYFIEREAPEGYVINTDKHYFEIKDDKEVVSSTLSNRLINGKIKIVKKNHNNKYISNALIGIYDLNDNLIMKDYTNNNGEVLFNLDYGKYYYMEIEAPEGYILNNNKYYFDILEDNIEKEYTLLNEEIPDIPQTGYNNRYLFTLLILSIIYISYSIIERKEA